ncbi:MULTISPECIES: MAPEG family protein [Pseudovibrio]|uniref:MAPEG family protein n=1 Tax=Stappiaceae TaxID=2821832 RepID=UPI00236740D6|nr:MULTISPECIES: MAPEG family protein [Pseudovibrio]MDD7909742.1 MAPEG family protein [Pseudovibrio exalbescens]MDX5592084.1 MAPEG family protein [Pseudovibrio sp. SPO723]
MPFAIWSILIAGLLPLVALLPGKMSKSFDNSDPRNPEYWSEPFRRRAQSAHYNSLEAFPFFAVAVFVALGQGGDPEWINSLCGLFLSMRVLYIACFWLNRASLRSLTWTVGFACTIAIFTTPVWT